MTKKQQSRKLFVKIEIQKVDVFERLKYRWYVRHDYNYSNVIVLCKILRKFMTTGVWLGNFDLLFRITVFPQKYSPEYSPLNCGNFNMNKPENRLIYLTIHINFIEFETMTFGYLHIGGCPLMTVKSFSSTQSKRHKFHTSSTFSILFLNFVSPLLTYHRERVFFR